MQNDKFYYQANDNLDVISRVEPLLANRSWYVNAKTGLITQTFMGADITTPWVYVKHASRLDCFWWKGILFNFFSDVLGTPPIGCHSCWKIVIRPKNVVQLASLERYLEGLKFKVPGCKLGCEQRPKVNALYGAYVYFYSQEVALTALPSIRSSVRTFLNDDIDVFLKRGCTEYEEHWGDPDMWAIHPSQQKNEDFIRSCFAYERINPPMPEILKAKVRKLWVRKACEHGDKEYRNLTEMPFHVEYKRYEDV